MYSVNLKLNSSIINPAINIVFNSNNKIFHSKPTIYLRISIVIQLTLDILRAISGRWTADQTRWIHTAETKVNPPVSRPTEQPGGDTMPLLWHPYTDMWCMYVQCTTCTIHTRHIHSQRHESEITTKTYMKNQWCYQLGNQ